MGPVLFLVHIRNIFQDLSLGTTASSFADDTRVQRGVYSGTDCSALQADLQLIYSWSEKVNMTFNREKFECMRYWADPAKAPDYQYSGPDSKPIKVKTDLRDLGVSDLSFIIYTVTAWWDETNFLGRD